MDLGSNFAHWAIVSLSLLIIEIFLALFRTYLFIIPADLSSNAQ
ncbi:hypothetical protein VCRA2112O187_6410001 [Vibrio crassostreae]|nr:hypothetical protein VCRA2112O187_6410001 [Vibrio crassostreae]CAK2975842.1 hypothetical protein VCRA2119O149_5530002 [Vibrio crassostreae]